MQHQCPHVAPELLRAARENLARHKREHPPQPIDDAAIARALSYPATPHFMTTNRYWDCECERAYHRPAGMEVCEDCDAWAEDMPDSRINELRAHGIHLDWNDPELRASLEAHYSG